ncbi:MAG: TIGR04086 family membrane protein [Clostridiales bacterium]|nr:TIGR04086 family membrane protein [Clostridiales bacterium]
MNPSKPKALLRSLLVSYLVSGILLLVLSLILYRLKLKEAQVNTAVYVIYLLACLTGGLLAGKALISRRFFWGLLSGLLYFAVLAAVSWLLRRGTAGTTSMEQTTAVLACCAAGGIIGGIMS